MNEGRIWLYVKPTIGVPLFFIAFVAASLLVHGSILMNTTWFSAFWQGGAAMPAAVVETASAPAMEAAPAEMAPAAETNTIEP